MSGLLALLDDVAAIAKLAAASVDDIAGAAAKAGAKAAGVVIDDAAVTPKYVVGFKASRELPIIGRIAVGSLRNKLVILLPALLLLDYFLPRAITPLLMLGGGYLCFEGAEKVYHLLFPGEDPHEHAPELARNEAAPEVTPSQLEEERVAGAITTDFILSAEIMTLALSVIEIDSRFGQVAALAIVGVLITIGVYGAVALIVKMDDVGVYLLRRRGRPLLRRIGYLLVRGMPWLLAFLSVVGTAAMLWVGGNIVLHGLDVTGLMSAPYELIHRGAEAMAQLIGYLPGLVSWVTTALLDGLFGLALGLALVPVVNHVVIPLGKRWRRKLRKALRRR